MGRKRTFQMAEIALMSGVLCVLAPFTIPLPFSPVPVTLGTFAVYLSASLLGAKRGTISVLIYLLLGAVGLPVFSGFSGGFGVLAGPTGGYLVGYVPCALLIGSMVECKVKTECSRVIWNIFSMVLGTVVCYMLGIIWFLVIMKGIYTIGQALLVCVVPYLFFDTIKIVLAGVITVPVKRVLKKSGM